MASCTRSGTLHPGDLHWNPPEHGAGCSIGRGSEGALRLSDVVASHGFAPCHLATIEVARLYQRQHSDGVLELLCVQKLGAEMRVDRQPLIPLVIDGQITMPLFLPVGEAVSDQRIPKDRLEDYLNTTL